MRGTITKKSLQCLQSKPLMEYAVINIKYQRSATFVLTLKYNQKCKNQRADLVCLLFSKVDNGDVNIHMVSVRGQLLHTSTCDTIWGNLPQS